MRADIRPPSVEPNPVQRVLARRRANELVVERSGTPREDAADVLGWLMRWLRNRLSARRSASARARASGADPTVADAWSAYQRLLRWAERQGLGRRPAETTGQLATRLAKQAPEAADAVDLVTTTYEWERYGAIHPPADRLRTVRRALEAFTDR